MNKVKIHIAGASDEFSAELFEIGDFVRRLNDCYLDKGIYFALTTDGGIDALSGCDLAFFLLHTKADHDITNALDAALDCYRKNGKPKVITYFKTGDAPPTEAVERLKERLGKETDYYYNTYSHIDTLKLGVMMNIKQLDLDGVDVRLEDGKAWQGGEALLFLDHVEMVSGYEDLQRLKTERAALEDGFYAAKTRYAENPEDNALYEAYFEASSRRNEAIKEIHDIEARLYHMIEGMYEQTATGRLSRRQVEGYQLMERGLFKEAQLVLDFDGIISESRHDEALSETISKRAQVHVNELLQLIEVNKTLGDWPEVDACYKEAVKLEENHSLPKKAMPDYVKFLYEQNRHPGGIKIAEKLKHYYQAPDENTPEEEKGRLYNSLALLYRDSQRVTEAVEIFKAAIEMFKGLVESGVSAVLPDLAKCYCDLGILYEHDKKIDESETMHNAALEIRKKLAAAEPFVFDYDLAYSYNNLGNLFFYTQRVTEAEKMYKSALEIQERLALYNNTTYKFRVFASCINLANVYRDTQRMNEAEEMNKAALEIIIELAGQNPDAYDNYLALGYNNLGVLYYIMQRRTEAETIYQTALEINKRLAYHNPEAFEDDLAMNYSNLGEIYRESGRMAEAEMVLVLSVNIREKIAEKSLDTGGENAAISFTNLACLYRDTKKTVEAEEQFNAALHYLLALAGRGVEPRMAICYHEYGVLLRNTKRTQEAEEMYKSAFEIRKELAESNPDAYETALADSYYRLGELYAETARTDEAEEEYQEALRLYEKYASVNPECAKQAGETRERLDRLREAPAQSGGSMDLLTPEEREIVLLLMKGESQRDISRKLNLTAQEVNIRCDAIWAKLGGVGISDPVVSIIAKKHNLSRRETDILRCLCLNMTNAEITENLFLAEPTVRGHVRSLLKKLSVENRVDIPAWIELFKE